MVKWQSATKIGPFQFTKRRIQKTYISKITQFLTTPPSAPLLSLFHFQDKRKTSTKNMPTHNLYGHFLSSSKKRCQSIFGVFLFFCVNNQSPPKDTMLGTSRRSYKWRSQALSDEIRDSGGAQRAVELIQELMPRSKRATLQSKYGIWKKKDVCFGWWFLFGVKYTKKRGVWLFLIRKHILG